MVDSIRKEDESRRTSFPNESIAKKSRKSNPGRAWPIPGGHDNFPEGVTSSRNLAPGERSKDGSMFP